MYHLPRLFGKNHQKQKQMNSSRAGARAAKPKMLTRRNANNNIEYDASSSSSASTSSYSPENSSSSHRTRSLEISPWGDRTSFRIEGNDGDFEIICQNLGLSGIDDFTIPIEAWEAYTALKVRSSSDVLPRMNLSDSLSVANEDITKALDKCTVSNVIQEKEDVVVVNSVGVKCIGGIKGVRPPVLAPPPVMKNLTVIENGGSSWDILRSFGPEDEKGMGLRDDAEVEVKVEEEEGIRGGSGAFSESPTFSTSSNQGGSSSTSTETTPHISPNTSTEPTPHISPSGRFRREITSWERGDLLGRGSFGSVYEGMAEGGSFFAIKEVSILLDQGEDARQSIYQLQQEIALLSQFEHENIVRYYGTAKDDSKLYIFLELVPKGSLLSTYQKYVLKDSQVSVYTRQILLGLQYLHDRNVVHRDIKCANILVGVDGQVKLADFGLAKATKFNDVKSCKGTPYWMAPEVIKSQGYGLPADIWSLGCTVLEMLTRQFPYSHLENFQAMYRIGGGELPRIPVSLSKDARDFIIQCLRVDPDARPTAAQLLDHSFVRVPLPSSASASPHHPDRGDHKFTFN